MLKLDFVNGFLKIQHISRVLRLVQTCNQWWACTDNIVNYWGLSSIPLQVFFVYSVDLFVNDGFIEQNILFSLPLIHLISSISLCIVNTAILIGREFISLGYALVICLWRLWHCCRICSQTKQEISLAWSKSTENKLSSQNVKCT